MSILIISLGLIIVYFVIERIIVGNLIKKIKITYQDIKKNAQLIDDYIISLEKPNDLDDERHMNIVTNLKTVLMVNRRTIDLYFDKFNKLERKIKKLESKVKKHESPKNSQKIRINISMRDDLYIATSEDLLGLFVADKNIIELFKEIPQTIKAIENETRRDIKRAEKAQD